MKKHEVSERLLKVIDELSEKVEPEWKDAFRTYAIENQIDELYTNHVNDCEKCQAAMEIVMNAELEETMDLVTEVKDLMNKVISGDLNLKGNYNEKVC